MSTINWQPVATIAAPIIAFWIGFIANRKLERRPRLVSFISHSASVPVRPPNGFVVNVHTHTVVVRNAGLAPANNVRLSHSYLPQDFIVFPPIPYSVENLQNGAADIVFPKLVPSQQISVTYIYYPPIIVDQVNTACKSDEGFAKIVSVLWNPQPSPWRRGLVAFLVSVGVITLAILFGWLITVAWSYAIGP
jgi:hypothetical protein